MRGKLTGGADFPRFGQQQRQAQNSLQRLDRDTAGAQQPGRAVQPENCRFHAHRAGAAIDHGIDPSAQPFQHMRGARGADAARRVGRRRGQRPAKGAQQGLGHGMGRDAQRNRGQARRHKIGQAGPCAQRQHQGQRPRPERGGQRFGPCIEICQPARRGHIWQMHDQRVEARPPLGLENPRHGKIRPRVAAKAIDRFGREGDKTALPQKVCGLRKPGGQRVKTFGEWHVVTQR